jgi:hypothetical protein
MKSKEIIHKSGDFGKWLLYLHRILTPHPSKSISNYVSNRIRHRAFPRMADFIQVDPTKITLWLTDMEYPDIEKSAPGSVIPGDWDRFAIDLTVLDPSENFCKAKQVSVLQRYAKGVPWGETDLFVHHYSKMVTSGGARGFFSLEELEEHYKRKYDSLFEVISREGIRRPVLSDPFPTWMYLHIGRRGELLYSSHGNHRLAMAIVCGQRSVPLRVLARHFEWQCLRDDVARRGQISREFYGHPDMQSILAA